MMLSVTVLLFAISTSLWALDVTQLMQGFKVMLFQNDANNLSQGVNRRYELLDQKSVYMEGFFMLTMIIGDSVVIWRAWVISNRHKVVFAPIIFIIVSAVFGVIDVVCLTEVDDGVHHTTSIPPGSRMCTWSEPIAWALSLCTNLMSTSIIAWKVWSHRRFMRRTLGSTRPLSRAERVLVLLVESGFVYCLFWFSQVILFFPFTRADRAVWAFEVLAPLGDQISGLYPTIIIVLVNMQHSLHDTHVYETGTVSGHSVEGSRRFAHGKDGLPIRFKTIPNGRTFTSDSAITSNIPASDSELGEQSHSLDGSKFQSIDVPMRPMGL
jgi:hypothetical protein